MYDRNHKLKEKHELILQQIKQALWVRTYTE